jgi:hypothetical protein
MELGHKRVKGPLIDERDLDVVALSEMPFENFTRPNAAIAAAKDENSLFISHD